MYEHSFTDSPTIPQQAHKNEKWILKNEFMLPWIFQTKRIIQLKHAFTKIKACSHWPVTLINSIRLRHEHRWESWWNKDYLTVMTEAAHIRSHALTIIIEKEIGRPVCVRESDTGTLRVQRSQRRRTC